MEKSFSISYKPEFKLKNLPRQPLRYFPLVLLLAANIITIINAVSQQWDLKVLLWIFLAQSFIIGFFHFLRILSLNEFSTTGMKINSQPVEPTPKTKKTIALAFLGGYGGFNGIYLIFLLKYTMSDPVAFMKDFSLLDYFLAGLSFLFFLFCTGASYFSYRKNIKNMIPKAGPLFFGPFARIIPMHLILTVFGIFVSSSDNKYDSAGLIIFLALKTIADAIMHIVEHTRPVQKKSAAVEPSLIPPQV